MNQYQVDVGGSTKHRPIVSHRSYNVAGNHITDRRALLGFAASQFY
jgi:hypothetical protein